MSHATRFELLPLGSKSSSTHARRSAKCTAFQVQLFFLKDRYSCYSVYSILAFRRLACLLFLQSQSQIRRRDAISAVSIGLALIVGSGPATAKGLEGIATPLIRESMSPSDAVKKLK